MVIGSNIFKQNSFGFFAHAIKKGRDLHESICVIDIRDVPYELDVLGIEEFTALHVNEKERGNMEALKKHRKDNMLATAVLTRGRSCNNDCDTQVFVGLQESPNAATQATVKQMMTDRSFEPSYIQSICDEVSQKLDLGERIEVKWGES